MDVPAGGTLATRLERQWFGGPNAPGAPPPPQPPPDARGSVDGAPVSSDTGGEDEDAVETSSAVAESIGSRVRWPHSAAALWKLRMLFVHCWLVVLGAKLCRGVSK